MERSNVDVMRSATQLEAMRRGLGVDPMRADEARTQGRDAFYNAFWGRYGLPGNVLSNPISTVGDFEDRFDLTDMSATDVIALARDLLSSGLTGRTEASLLGFDFDALPFAGDRAFLSSPLAILQGGLSQPTALGRSYNWLNEYQSQLTHLQDNGAAPTAVKSTRNVLDQLNRLQTEQNMYWAMGFYSEGSKRQGDGFLSGGLLAPMNVATLMRG